MPKLTKSERKKVKAEIREWMVKVPGISVLNLSQKVGRAYNFVNYLKKEIDEENIRSIEQEVVEGEILKFQMLVEGLMPHLWNIVVGRKKILTKLGDEIEVDTTPKERAMAIRIMIENFKDLFDKKFDAGIFAKKLGEVEVRNKADLLKVILENLDEPIRAKFIESAERFLEGGSEGGSLQFKPPFIYQKGNL